MERSGSINKNEIIKFDHVDKSFDTENGKFDVVEDLEFTVKENEFLVLFGPGQCGKTTILNMLAGFEKPTSGSITLNNNEIKGPAPERGMVFQTTALFPWLRVIDNVSYGPKVCGIPKDKRLKIAEEYIKLVGLDGFEQAYPNQLSGGMRQRVGIARAYANEPLVMILDEPFGHLDAQTRYLMQEELIRIWETEKRTVVFVTNNIEEAIYLADRILVLKNTPTGIKAEFEVNLPRPRNYTDEEFLKLRREIDEVVDHTL